MSRVREFHAVVLGETLPDHPTVPDTELAALRVRLIGEEHKEYQAEARRLLAQLRFLRNRGRNPANNADITVIMQALVKELCDLRYVVEGTLVAFGVEPTAYDEVHRSNMTKDSASKDGTARKGERYTAADPELMFPSIIDATCEEDE